MSTTTRIVIRTNQPPRDAAASALSARPAASATSIGSGAVSVIGSLLLTELADVPDHHRDDGEEEHHRDRRAAAVVVADEEPLGSSARRSTSVPFASALPITNTMSNTFSALITM